MSRLSTGLNFPNRIKAPRNKTIEIRPHESRALAGQIKKINSATKLRQVINATIQGDMLRVVSYLPGHFVDLLFLDPPYNLNKSFNGKKFSALSAAEYETVLDGWIKPMVRLLKPTASVYLCGDWRSSAAIYNVCSKYFKIQNRITWEREKGRGARANWKNCTEDIWFCTVSDKFVFNLDSVKQKRAVIAPYRHSNGRPKDWHESAGGKYRLTAPSNIWTDITVPFWSMPENTDHPTQKPEKLLAKIILASSNENDIVLDPFLGSGTTSVVAKKLNRKFIGIERELEYCLLTLKRLQMAAGNDTIQGFHDKIFWERNSLNQRASR